MISQHLERCLTQPLACSPSAMQPTERPSSAKARMQGHRAQVPRTIPQSPVRPASSLHLPLSPSRDSSLLAAPSATIPAGHGAASSSASLVSANELPDDPERASNVVHLFAPPLAPAWSPVSMSRSQSSRTDDASSTYFPIGARASLSPRSPPYQAQLSPEANIFERNIQMLGSPHVRTPREAVDLAVPPVLDDAADAIVSDSTLEIVSPRSPPSPYASPSASHRTSGVDMLRGASHDGTWRQRAYGHRRLQSDQTSVMKNIPSSPAGQRRSACPPTPTAAPSVAHSPSLSIDGAVIHEGRAAMLSHSLDGIADAMVATDRSPGSSRLGHLPVPSASPSMHPSPGRKRLSWMSYADIVHDVNEQVYDIDPQV